MAEVRGSTPLSSTPTVDAAETIHVGAHEFRNHFGYYMERFGYYMERAAAGADVNVSRRGRPYVRMCAAAAPSTPSALAAPFRPPALAADE